jgi:hypothetical protein
MSVAMRAAQALGLLDRPPPGIITERALRLRPAAVEPRNALVNVAAHFGYGAALALPFAVIRRRRASRVSRAPVGGMAYGLAVYVANYELMLPALGLMPAAHDDYAGRVVTMTAAHLVYGAALELLLRPGEAAQARGARSCGAESAFGDRKLSEVG